MIYEVLNMSANIIEHRSNIKHNSVVQIKQLIEQNFFIFKKEGRDTVLPQCSRCGIIQRKCGADFRLSD